MTNENRLPELLAPAGSPAALEAAIEGGADAVYFGGSLFSCRMRAKNFSRDELSSAIRSCREANVRTYVTVNARLPEEEVGEALRFAEWLREAGADALIVSDAGLASLIAKYLPDLPLHASTQLSGANARDAAALQKLGFCRMVCPRELTGADIKALVRSSPLEIEMFIHGAHCVSFSGQCMMSFAMGGRSGNRGACAQPCRLPYTVEGHPGASDYPLSLRDMCLGAHVPEIIASGVSSLKIEGRQKSAEYVYGTTRVWRRLLDERRAATPDEIRELSSLFSRQGFTDGYYTGRYRSMGGIRTDEQKAADVSPFPGRTRTIPLRGTFSAAPGEKTVLTLTDGVRTGSAAGDVPAPAEKQPMTAESVLDSLGKLGGTCFSLASLDVDLRGELFLTKGQLNALRRDAVADLIALRPAREALSPVPDYKPARHPSAGLWTRRIGDFRSPAQIPEGARDFFDEIRLPLDECVGGAVPVLPPVMLDRDEPRIRRQLEALNPRRAVVHNFGELSLVREFGIEPVASFRFTVMNQQLLDVISAAGAAVVGVSPELPAGAVRALTGQKSAIVYGRLPLMLTMRCALSGGGDDCGRGGTGGSCGSSPEGRSCRGVLRDRTGASFPVLSSGCRSEIFNSVPTYMGDKPDELARLGLTEAVFLFTVETAEEAARVIDGYQNGTPYPGAIRRIR